MECNIGQKKYTPDMEKRYGVSCTDMHRLYQDDVIDMTYEQLNTLSLLINGYTTEFPSDIHNFIEIKKFLAAGLSGAAFISEIDVNKKKIQILLKKTLLGSRVSLSSLKRPTARSQALEKMRKTAEKEITIFKELQKLHKIVPNFPFYFGRIECDEVPILDYDKLKNICMCPSTDCITAQYILMEYIKGYVFPELFWYLLGFSEETLSSLIISKKLGEQLAIAYSKLNLKPIVKAFFEVLMQLALVLHIAKTKIQFKHDDLHHGNVIIVVKQETVNMEYQVGTETYKILTNYVPVIIDFDSSKIVNEVDEEPGSDIHLYLDEHIDKGEFISIYEKVIKVYQQTGEKTIPSDVKRESDKILEEFYKQLHSALGEDLFNEDFVYPKTNLEIYNLLKQRYDTYLLQTGGAANYYYKYIKYKTKLHVMDN